MIVESTIEKMQIVAKENEAHKNEHRQIQEEETKLLKKEEAKKQLRRAECDGVLNICWL